MKDDQEKFLAYLARNGMLTNAGPQIRPEQIQQLQNDRSQMMAKLQNIKPEPMRVGVFYQKQSLFDVPKGSILCHACNAQGVWGSGIAKEFKSKFPKSFKEYNEYCVKNPPYYTDGTTLVTKSENGYNVGCLITSSGFGSTLDAEQTILINTKHALEDLAKKAGIQTTFYSNKFNSGFFKVPWEQTEKLINDFVKKHNKTWIICDPNLTEDV